MPRSRSVIGRVRQCTKSARTAESAISECSKYSTNVVFSRVRESLGAQCSDHRQRGLVETGRSSHIGRSSLSLRVRASQIGRLFGGLDSPYNWLKGCYKR